MNKFSHRQLLLRLSALLVLIGILVYEIVSGESTGSVIDGLVIAAFGAWVAREAHLEMKEDGRHRNV
jgi:hypothetical protein